MFDPDNIWRCDFCENGSVTRRIEQINFRQLTDKGYVFCRAEVPIGICNRCGSKHWKQDAETIVDDIVRQEYEKLRCS
jgi:hypothetical protein